MENITYIAAGVSILTGLISGLTTVIIMKVDIRWIKKDLEDHSDRIYFLETNKHKRKHA